MCCDEDENDEGVNDRLLTWNAKISLRVEQTPFLKANRLCKALLPLS